MKFKVGDRVKIIYEEIIEDKHLIGKSGIIISKQEDIYAVDFGKIIKQSRNKVNGTTHHFWGSELELIETEELKEFKIFEQELEINLRYCI